MWGPTQPYIYPPMPMAYPPMGSNDVRFIAVPNDNGEAIKILKKQLKEMKEDKKKPKEEKKDDKKPREYRFLEVWALCLSSSVLTFMISGMFYWLLFRGGR